MMPKIVVVGSFNVDITSFMHRMPRPGETVHGREFMIGPGGKGSNQAVSAAALCVTKPGAAKSMPTRSEVYNLLNR